MLFSLKTGIANLGGGGVSNYIYNGWDAVWNAWNVKLWEKIDSRFKSRADIWKWVYDLGILNSMVYNEVGIRDIVSKKPEARAALEEVFDTLRKNPDVKDVRLAEIFKKHNVGQRFTELAGWIMKSTERVNRTWSFLSGYLSARKSYEYLDLPLNTPQLIEAGKKSVDTTQFLYDNANRGLFTSTNLGHIYGRFKLWAWRSVHYQRTLLNEAANQGFRPGSIEAERLERLVTANMFAVGLAALLPYTIFDAVLPGGLQTLQNLADWMFGNESERERAFYSQNNLILRGWLAPLNELTPPISRVPGALEVGFEWLFDPEFERKQQYVLWTTFIPFGRISYDLYRSFQNPAMATDFMLGIPLHRFQTLKNKSWGTGSRGI
jgi:hypothetical protein